MQRRQTLQAILDYIDDNIENEISAAMIAEKAGYSAFHFSRNKKGLPPDSPFFEIGGFFADDGVFA